MAAPSFAKDIVPIFLSFQEAMLWRLDLTDYDQVRPNAEIIYQQIASKDGFGPMPPPPYPPLTSSQIDLFKAWMDAGFPP